MNKTVLLVIVSILIIYMVWMQAANDDKMDTEHFDPTNPSRYESSIGSSITDTINKNASHLPISMLNRTDVFGEPVTDRSVADKSVNKPDTQTKPLIKTFGVSTIDSRTLSDTDSDSMKSDTDSMNSDSMNSDSMNSDSMNSDSMKSDPVKSNPVKSDTSNPVPYSDDFMSDDTSNPNMYTYDINDLRDMAELNKTRRSYDAKPDIDGTCEVAAKCSADTCGSESLHPILDPQFNMREVAKQCLLLEDHLNNIKKRCLDCIRKHFLIVDGLIEEAIGLEQDIPKRAEYRRMYISWLNFEKRYSEAPLDSDNLDGISKNIRVFRKPLVEKHFDLVKEYNLTE